MALDREALLTALEERLRDETDFVTVSRRVKHWDDTTPAEQPACFLTLGQQQPTYQSAGMPAIWTVFVTVYLYTTRKVGAGLDMTLATALTQVEAALERQPGDAPVSGAYLGGPAVSHQTTLGGVVLYARIAGDVVTDEGLLDDQQVAVVNVEMKVGA